jgi:hypothetical protein
VATPAPPASAQTAAGEPALSDAPPAPPSLEDFDFDQPDAVPDPASGEPTAGEPATSAPDPDLEELKALLGNVDPKTLTNRGRDIYAAFKARRELKASPEQGGLGFLPTTDDIKKYYDNSTQWEASEFEFQNNPESWLLNHLGPNEEGQLSPGALNVIDNFLPVLQNVNPQLFNRAVEPLISTTLSNLQREVSSIPEGQGKDTDPYGVDDRTRLQDAIDILTAKWGRGTRTNGQTPQPSARPAALPAGQPNDPLAQERAQIQQERERLNHEYGLLKKAAVDSVTDHVNRTVFSQINADIVNLAKAQGVTPDRFPTEWMYNQWIEGFRGAVASAVKGNPTIGKAPYNPNGWENFQIQFNRASAVAANGNLGRRYDPTQDPYAKEAVKAYLLIARPAIKDLAHQYLKDAGVSIVNGNGARTAAQAPSAEALAHREPATAGAPVAHSVVQPPQQFTRVAGEDPADTMSRFIKERMVQAQQQR